MIGKHQTGLCEGCREEESVEHIIITCKRYETEAGNEEYAEGDWGAGDHIKRVTKLNRSQSRILITFLREAGDFNGI